MIVSVSRYLLIKLKYDDIDKLKVYKYVGS